MISVSSFSQPAPIPNRKRPPEYMSSVATSLASSNGLRSGTRQMPVPSFSVFVTADALPSATNGSTMSAYTFGMIPSGEPGHGLDVSTGMIGCSGTQSDSKPISSARRARMAMSTE